MLIDSVIECLSTSFSQISGYVHFMDMAEDQNTLQINGGAIGVSSWLLTPEINSQTLKGLIVKLNIGRSMMIVIELNLDLAD